jgi:tRNA(Ile)-lysidine synthase
MDPVLMDLVEKTAAAIKKHHMLAGGETVLIGLSGGPDSVCLTALLEKLSRRLRLKLHAVYIDHGLRPGETPAEAAFCKSLCEGMDIPFYVEHVEVKPYARERGMSLQEAARELRYRALGAVALRVRAHRVALGHNLDDQAETLVMRLLRGTGPGGLAGIPAVRDNIIRPLMEVERSEIEDFLKKENIAPVVDSSNLKDDYLRNRIRSSLMPLLMEINPGIHRTLCRTAEILREEERYFGVAVTKAMMKLITRKTDMAIELFLSPLENMDRVILRRVLRRAVEETRGLKGIGFVHIEDIIRLIAEGRPGDRIHLPGGIRAIKKYSTLLITSEPPARLGTYTISVEGEVALKESSMVIKARVADEAPHTPPDAKTTAVLDADRARFPLTVRSRKRGDFFHPSGLGGRKKLQDYFVDEKVPRDERDSVPVVTSGGDIVWVAGMRPDERFIRSRDTKRFLVLEAGKLRE